MVCVLALIELCPYCIQEELGLFKDKGSELGLNSLLKMEQRLTKVGPTYASFTCVCVCILMHV